MKEKVKSIFPADDFRVVSDGAAEEIEAGLIVGYDSDGDLVVFGGGTIDGRRPTAKDWLWMVEVFKRKLLAGDYSKE